MKWEWMEMGKGYSGNFATVNKSEREMEMVEESQGIFDSSSF